MAHRTLRWLPFTNGTIPISTWFPFSKDQLGEKVISKVILCLRLRGPFLIDEGSTPIKRQGWQMWFFISRHVMRIYSLHLPSFWPCMSSLLAVTTWDAMLRALAPYEIGHFGSVSRFGTSGTNKASRQHSVLLQLKDTGHNEHTAWLRTITTLIKTQLPSNRSLKCEAHDISYIQFNEPNKPCKGNTAALLWKENKNVK